MRGVMYRTGADGETPLSTPELRISATKNRVAYYDNDTAKQAALSDGDIKEGTIVLTGYEGETEDYATMDAVKELLRKHDYVEDADVSIALSTSTAYTVPYDGELTVKSDIATSATGIVRYSINGIYSFTEITDIGGSSYAVLSVRKNDKILVQLQGQYTSPTIIHTRFYTQRDYSGR